MEGQRDESQNKLNQGRDAGPLSAIVVPTKIKAIEVKVEPGSQTKTATYQFICSHSEIVEEARTLKYFSLNCKDVVKK